MDQLLRQLGDLALGSVPTMVIFLILVGAYRALVDVPLRDTLAERRRRTAGAVEKAQAAIALADAKAQEYEARLRGARMEIMARREKQVQQWNQARDRAVADAREVAQGRIKEARLQIEQQTAQVRTELEAGIDQLAAQVLAAILPARSLQ
ncbi:MAG TPA: ATP synthase F0 subunit B [Acidobacteriaceae bacterium]